VLNASKEVCFIATGDSKADLLPQIVQPGTTSLLPSAQVWYARRSERKVSACADATTLSPLHPHAATLPSRSPTPLPTSWSSCPPFTPPFTPPPNFCTGAAYQWRPSLVRGRCGGRECSAAVCKVRSRDCRGHGRLPIHASVQH
jgi:hypothetical protein